MIENTGVTSGPDDRYYRYSCPGARFILPDADTELYNGTVCL